jgi:hypothetical protein
VSPPLFEWPLVLSWLDRLCLGESLLQGVVKGLTIGPFTDRKAVALLLGVVEFRLSLRVKGGGWGED